VSELGSDVSDEVSTRRAVVEGRSPSESDDDEDVSEASSAERYGDEPDADAGTKASDEEE
jgi:hypothetical protein